MAKLLIVRLALVFVVVQLSQLVKCEAEIKDKEGNKRSHDEMTTLFEALGQYGNDILIKNVRNLLAYDKGDDAKCTDRKYIQDMRLAILKAMKKYHKLEKELSDAYTRQIEACNYDYFFKRDVERFRNGSPDEWKLIQDYTRVATKYNFFESKSTGDMFLSRNMNELFIYMIKDMIEEGEIEDPQDIVMYADRIESELPDACESFVRHMGTSWQVQIVVDPIVKKRAETADWSRSLDVCKKMASVNFTNGFRAILSEYGNSEDEAVFEFLRDC